MSAFVVNCILRSNRPRKVLTVFMLRRNDAADSFTVSPLPSRSSTSISRSDSLSCGAALKLPSSCAASRSASAELM